MGMVGPRFPLSILWKGWLMFWLWIAYTSERAGLPGVDFLPALGVVPPVEIN